MDWLADILKNLTISKTLIAAVFVTSVVMHFGPIFVPNAVPKLPSEVAPYFFAVMILTGCLLAFFGLAALWNLTRTSVRSAAKVLADSTLSEPEEALLFVMAKDPTEPINLNSVDYSRAPGTKLEFHHWTNQLQDKGLVRINPWDDNLVSLTDLGRRRALEIQRQVNRNNAASSYGR